MVVRVGGSKPIHTDARVIAATNQNLAEMVRQKRFRQDLYFRLNVVTLELPPLRRAGRRRVAAGRTFPGRLLPPGPSQGAARSRPAARKRLEQHLWPGNVRELRNLMERLAYLLPGDTIEADDLAFILSPAGQSPALRRPRLAAVRSDRHVSDRIHQEGDRAGQGQHEPGRRAAGPAPLESLPQDAAARHELGRRRGVGEPWQCYRASGPAETAACVRRRANPTRANGMPANTMLPGSGVATRS